MVTGSRQTTKLAFSICLGGQEVSRISITRQEYEQLRRMPLAAAMELIIAKDPRLSRNMGLVAHIVDQLAQKQIHISIYPEN